jgi:hypothetical protein
MESLGTPIRLTDSQEQRSCRRDADAWLPDQSVRHTRLFLSRMAQQSYALSTVPP